MIYDPRKQRRREAEADRLKRLAASLGVPATWEAVTKAINEGVQRNLTVPPTDTQH